MSGHQNGHQNGHSLQPEELFLLGGDIGDRKHGEASEAGPPRTSARVLQQSVELHVCMGLNACQGHGYGESGKLAGTGDCATVLHVCHGANECRGQGGCGYSGTDAEQAKPGDQSCRLTGCMSRASRSVPRRARVTRMT